MTISPDHLVVGWTVIKADDEYPTKLVVFSYGRQRQYGGGLPLEWAFLSGGRQVGFRQETLHGGMEHSELHDVRTGKTLATYDPPTGAELAAAPEWVRAVIRAEGQKA